MLMLVTADNLVQLFFGWEGVGLASYLLIGFWYQKPSAVAAAMKAFIVNRVGDFGFLLGIFLCFVLFGSVSFDAIFPRAADLAKTSLHFIGMDWHALTLASLLLFIGAMGKSAQFVLAYLAAGRDGGADAGLRADPCGHHGDGGRVPGGAHVAGV
jgi:NADH-quinone oxidoreductase subunit L